MAISCELDQIWVPGMSLDNDYPIATNEELEQAWRIYTGSDDIRSTNDVYGVYRPAGSIAAIASIDLCEVVRESAFCVDRTYGMEPTRRQHYKDGTWVQDADDELEKTTTAPIVQAAMNAGLSEPDPDIEEISETMRDWRNAGIYVAANTSTLPGCELATVEKFMSKYMIGCFDALILPRNHDGKGSITKAKALGFLATDLGLDLSSVPMVKIDDATHHIEGFLSLYGEHDRATYFIPKHVGNATSLAEYHTDTSLQAFEKATEFFEREGIKI